ncbi:MAG TPA: LptF/LptG family permease, partial [Alphaproteobacteria bacterium]|nr:LptF/LptG family permease [Alphaproteobacteria bacterium]
MMLLTRYLLRQESMAILLITIVITGAVWFSQSLRLLELVVEGGAPLLVFFEMMLLVLPSFLVPIIPISLFLGLLFIMQKLLQDQEWIVMQGIGLGPFQLARPALLLAAGVMVLHWGISIDLAPSAQRELRFQRRLVQTDYAGALLREGTFNAIGSNMTIYVRERKGSNLFHGILIHD